MAVVKRYFCSKPRVALQLFVLIVTSISLISCNRPQPTPKPTPKLKTIALDDKIKAVVRQTVYISVYSHIYTMSQNQTMELTATLSVRNTDLTNPIVIAAIRYHDTNGKLVRQYLEQPVELRPLASAEFVVAQEDTSGGAGASFIVEWLAQNQVSNPVVEAVMINTMGNQGVSFVSQGRVIKDSRTQNK